MTADESDALPVLDAGGFGTWLSGMAHALRSERDADVPCGDCTACCTSSQFVHVGPEEVDALDRIPRELLFPAPGLPTGHRVMGYDERGHCPMLIDGACSIYSHRPRACRTYDCRVFPAAGVRPDDDKPAIDARVGRWRFTYESVDDEIHHDAVRAAATFLAGHPDRPAARRASSRTGLAVLAVEVHDVFLGADPATDELEVVSPSAEEVEAAVIRRRPA